MMNTYDFIITEELEETRIDKCVLLFIKDLSRSYVQKLIESESLTVNGKPVKASYKVKTDDRVEIAVPESVQPAIEAEDIPLDILYEDEDVLVINKPKGMVVHPAAGHYSGTLVNAIMFHCRDSLSGINGVLRPGIVHRIDMDTTGSIIVCKNDAAHNSIAEQLKEHSIRRIYDAIVYGEVKEDEGTIDAPIGRAENDRKRMAINRKNGKNAVTHYKVVTRYKGFTHIKCQLETGRTHQIRVHMSSIHHPLLGDEIYAGGYKSSFKLQGQCLHAGVLGFVHPRTGEYIETLAPLPEYFQHLLDIL